MIWPPRFRRPIASGMATSHEGRALEIVAARVEVVGRAGDELAAESSALARRTGCTRQSTTAYIDGGRRSVPLL